MDVTTLNRRHFLLAFSMEKSFSSNVIYFRLFDQMDRKPFPSDQEKLLVDYVFLVPSFSFLLQPASQTTAIYMYLLFTCISSIPVMSSSFFDRIEAALPSGTNLLLPIHSHHFDFLRFKKYFSTTIFHPLHPSFILRHHKSTSSTRLLPDREKKISSHFYYQQQQQQQQPANPNRTWSLSVLLSNRGRTRRRPRL